MVIRFQSEVFQFLGVILEIVHLFDLPGDEPADIFVLFRTQRYPPGDRRIAYWLTTADIGVFPKIMTCTLHQQRAIPFGVGVGEQWCQVLPVHLPGLFHADQREKGRRDILAADWHIAYCACRNPSRQPHDHRRFDIGIIGRHLESKAVLSPGKSLVRRKDDQGIIQLAHLLYGADHPANPFIQGAHAPVVLLFPIGEGPSIPDAYRLALVALAPNTIVPHMCRLGRARRIDVFWRGDLGNIWIVLEMAVSHFPGSVYCVIAQPEVPGLIRFLCPSTEKFKCILRVVIGRIAANWFRRPPVDTHILIDIIRPVFLGLAVVPDGRKIPVPTVTMIGTCVPFADDACVPTVLTEILEPVRTLVWITDIVWVARGQVHAHHAMRQFSGQVRGA